MDTTLVSRVGLQSLSDVENFLSALQHIKGLTIQLNHVRARRSRRELSLANQIAALREVCGDKARESTRLGDLWKIAQDELRELQEPEPAPGLGCPGGPTGPCQGGSHT